jgi:hypothetical protein
MKTFALAALILAVCASPSLARSARVGPPKKAAVRTASNGPRAAAVLGRDGQDASRHCSNENPNIEYRDCVNASTRDPNAKIRLG